MLKFPTNDEFVTCLPSSFKSFFQIVKQMFLNCHQGVDKYTVNLKFFIKVENFTKFEITFDAKS